jgi:hypothetical protein
MMNRRNWILTAAAPIVSGIAQGQNKLAVRRDAGQMKPDDDALVLYKTAVREMRRRSDKNKLDPLGWYQNGALHSLFCATNDFDLQVHYSWFFLPWHRGYLAFLEKKMQAVIGEPRLALPYWDWTSSPKIPSTFYGLGNPLADFTRLQKPADTIPSDFLDVGPSLRARNFHFFGGYPKSSIKDDQIEGVVEQGVHNNTHNWIGGDMASFPSAGFDPLFCTHHGNIDRLWEAWLAQGDGRHNPDDPRFLNHTFDFHDEKGKSVRIPVRDLLKIADLGYSYDNLHFQSAAVDATSPRTPVVLRFERLELPMHPLSIRVFLSRRGEVISYDPVAPEYVGTFTLLPVGSHHNGGLEDLVTMQIELPASAAELIQSNAPYEFHLVPVALRGRTIPTAPLRLRSVKISPAL